MMLRSLLLTVLAAPAIIATASADTLEDALAAAYRNNPTIVDARLAVRSANEDRIQAQAAYLPQVGVSATYGAQETEIESQNFFGPVTNTLRLSPWTGSIQLQQQLYTGGRRLGQSRLARASVEGARHGLRATEQDVLLAAVEAYLTVIRDREIVRLNREHVAGLTRQVAGTRRRLEVGEVTRTDLAQAQSRLAGAEGQLARAASELAQSQARYEAVIGRAPQDLAQAPYPETPDDLDGAIAQAEERHPDLMRARSNVAAARARVDIERAALRPQVSVVTRYDESEAASSVDDRRTGSSAVAQLSVPLFEGGLAASRTRQGRINVQRAQTRVEIERRQIESNIINSWNDLIAGRQIVESANQQVAATQDALYGAERERGIGLRSTLDVLNAEEERRTALENLVRAEAEAKFAAYALLASTGMLGIETLGLDD
jgi:outer membrane protein